jgi:hypothetical protein
MGKKLTDGRKVGSGLAEGSKINQFQPGNAGRAKKPPYNQTSPTPPRSSRKKTSEEFEELLDKELDAEMSVNLDGRHIKTTKKRIAAKQIANQFAKGDLATHRIFHKLRADRNAKGGRTIEELNKEDQEVWDDWLKGFTEGK